LPDSHRNHFSVSQILIVEFPKHDRKNYHAAIVRFGSALLWYATIISAYRIAVAQAKKWGFDKAPSMRLIWQTE
jgi:hypothetical protein